MASSAGLVDRGAGSSGLVIEVLRKNCPNLSPMFARVFPVKFGILPTNMSTDIRLVILSSPVPSVRSSPRGFVAGSSSELSSSLNRSSKVATRMTDLGPRKI